MKAVDLIPPEVVLRRAIQDRLRAWAKRLALSALAVACVYGGLHIFVHVPLIVLLRLQVAARVEYAHHHDDPREEDERRNKPPGCG